MATLNTKLPLNTGANIPAIGFGTWQDKDEQEDAVISALKAGYRHIDTARVYGTEPAVGRAIKKSGIPRSEIFITTKLWNNSHAPEDVEPAIDASLKDLDTDYLDLYLMHWPSAFKSGDSLMPKDANGKIQTADVDYVDGIHTQTYKAMEKLQKSGKARAIGVSNFSQKQMNRLVKEASIPPAAHQIELHPYLQQPAFVKWHHDNRIHVQHYSPFGNQNEIYSKGQHMEKLINDPILAEIGKKYGKSGAQVALAWGIQSGNSVLPKSKTPKRIQDNIEGDFKLEKADVEKVGTLDQKLRFNDPSENFGMNFYEDLDGKQ
ncbi:uncharacterized protein KY384_002062 [Bacidia gigantensis]|uniref:uncharacterized protein n=1 Tax=Bacidia gigantensis TaxID=2732470 RepID=UPI001D05622E|nr:uncharacterized protein KY384_002062 [Bacidia gigantensis]KAG8533279.1 hypothetical protein KY384_002062 [Bacidia gigantensis]